MNIRDLKREECARLAEIDSSYASDKIYKLESCPKGRECIAPYDLEKPVESMPPMFGATSQNAALRYQDNFDHYDMFIVAEEDDRFIGAACTFPLKPAFTDEVAFLAMPGELLLLALSVNREHRGRGVGRALLDRVKAHCVENGYKFVSLWTGFDFYPAVQFYLSEGFKISGWQAPPGCKFDQCRIYMTWVP